MYREVLPELEKIKEIVECYFTTGPFTILCKVYAYNNEHLMELLNNRIQTIPSVVSTDTIISLEQSIEREVPVVYKPKTRGRKSKKAEN